MQPFHTTPCPYVAPSYPTLNDQALSYEVVMEKAHNSFKGHQYEEEIIHHVNRLLEGYKYASTMNEGKRPMIIFSNRLMWDHSAKDSVILGEAEGFLKNLPGISVSWNK